MPTSAEVDAYIAAAVPLRRERLQALRDLIHAVAPDVAESIEWKMPVYRLGTEYLAIASQKSYLSIYFGAENVGAILAAVPGLKGGKGCLNIGDRTPLPLAALEPAIRRRLGIAETSK